MFNLADRMYLAMMNKVSKLADELKGDERGVAPFVATIILILIVVILCAIFFDYISEWFETIWAQIMGEANTIKRPQ